MWNYIFPNGVIFELSRPQYSQFNSFSCCETAPGSVYVTNAGGLVWRINDGVEVA